MSELSETYKAMSQVKKERHREMFLKNMEILTASKRIQFSANETVCLFREKGMPKVDFYPHTGRWKFEGHMFKGGAVKFLEWYFKKSSEAQS